MKENNIENNGQAKNIISDIEENTVTFYTNSANLAVGYFDFQFLFKEQHPSFAKKGTDSINSVRIIMSPQHAKVLNMILEKHIKDYEKNFGEIGASKEFLENINFKTEE